MSQSITDHDFINQLDNLVRDFVKEQLETIMEEERKQFFEVEHPELKSSLFLLFPLTLENPKRQRRPIKVL